MGLHAIHAYYFQKRHVSWVIISLTEIGGIKISDVKVSFTWPPIIPPSQMFGSSLESDLTRLIDRARNEIIIFIDSDLIVLSDFIQKHVKKLTSEWKRNNKKCFTYGSVINTSNFKNPEKTCILL